MKQFLTKAQRTSFFWADSHIFHCR